MTGTLVRRDNASEEPVETAAEHVRIGGSAETLEAVAGRVARLERLAHLHLDQVAEPDLGGEQKLDRELRQRRLLPAATQLEQPPSGE